MARLLDYTPVVMELELKVPHIGIKIETGLILGLVEQRSSGLTSPEDIVWFYER